MLKFQDRSFTAGQAFMQLYLSGGEKTGNKQGLFAPQEPFGFCKGLWVSHHHLPNRKPFFKALKQLLSISYWRNAVSLG